MIIRVYRQDCRGDGRRHFWLIDWDGNLHSFCEAIDDGPIVVAVCRTERLVNGLYTVVDRYDMMLTLSAVHTADINMADMRFE